MELPDNQAAALDRSIAQPRLGTYLAATNGDLVRARQLYLWDRDLSAAFLADLAILEVALRNAMSARLHAQWGPQWPSNTSMPLDDRSLGALHTAWRRAGRPRTPGKIVAQCTFGFWRGLLDEGGYSGKDPRRTRCNYEILWRGVLDKAFPGGKAQARRDGLRWNREYALNVVTRVRETRNRVAHHEPMLNGVPLPGQGKRLSPEEAQEDLMRLAAMLDRDLHAFMIDRSTILHVLANRP